MSNDKRNTNNLFIVEKRKDKDNTVSSSASKKPAPKQKVNLGWISKEIISRLIFP
jgi:hypothetical protein